MKKKDQNLIPSQRTYRLWCKCMELGERTGCHQLPERSFFFKGYQMPVCARCTGVIIGYLLAVPGFFLLGIHGILSVFGCFSMLTDWGLQALKLKTSTNKRRFITGILGGYGIMTVQLGLIKKILKTLQLF